MTIRWRSEMMGRESSRFVLPRRSMDIPRVVVVAISKFVLV
jgi:hypothetical protein